ncbi:MAG: outer membrane lipoprotein-sorting protein [Nitrospirota bacterium]
MLVAALVTIGPPPQAAAGDVIVEDIVARVMAQDDAVRDQTALVEIRRIAASGEERVSTHRLYWKNLVGNNGLLGKTLLVSLSPVEKRGEGFLLWQAARANESQAWLYLPDLRQVRRVAVAGHDEHAHGPDSTADLNLGFEQLGTRLTGVTGSLIGKEVLDGVPHVILEDRSSASADLLPLRRFWISAADWTIGKIEYRHADGRLARTQRIVWERLGDAWVWKRTEIQPADGSGKTIVELRDIALNTSPADRVFTVETLKSGRIP